MLRRALVNGTKQLALKGARATCPTCNSPVIAKCGQIKAQHWAHQSRDDCDPWSEDVGPWHLSWQDIVEDEFVEVSMGPHRADIANAAGLVVELQHSSISPEEIGDRERFYRNMVWMFDATERFPCLPSGDRVFFSLQNTEHVKACKRGVFLDCDHYIVEVECFTDVFDKFSGFGRLRDREWFVSRYLSGCLKPGWTPAARTATRLAADRWRGKQPWRLTEYSWKWREPASVNEITYPEKSLYIQLTYSWVNRVDKTERPVWSDVIAKHPAIANGWTDADLKDMKALLKGIPIILGGVLRIMPAPTKYIEVNQTVATIRRWLDKAQVHMQAGRIPILEPESQEELLNKARQNEINRYGQLLQPEPEVNRERQHELFE